jgi:hypothetical protein
VTSDDAGFGSSWFLERIIVKDMESTSTYIFPCHKWLSSSEDDKQLTRELVCMQDDVKSYLDDYRISTTTSPANGSGTTVSKKFHPL